MTDRQAQKVVIEESDYFDAPETKREYRETEEVHSEVIEEKTRNRNKKRARIIKVKSVKRLPQEIVQYVDAYTKPFPRIES